MVPGMKVLIWFKAQIGRLSAFLLIVVHKMKLSVLKTHTSNPSVLARMEAAIRSIQRIVETDGFVSFIKWIHVDTAIPVIPEGRYAVSVMVLCYDRVYAECCKKKGWQDSGWDIHASVVYGTTTNRKGEKQRMYENSDLLFDFQEMYESSEGSEWGPVGDKVVYWAYLPEIPQGLK